MYYMIPSELAPRNMLYQFNCNNTSNPRLNCPARNINDCFDVIWPVTKGLSFVLFT